MCWHVHGVGWGAAPIRCEQDGGATFHRHNLINSPNPLSLTCAPMPTKGAYAFTDIWFIAKQELVQNAQKHPEIARIT